MYCAYGYFSGFGLIIYGLMHRCYFSLEAPQEGRMPQAENEIIVDTFTLDELMLPYALGEKIPIKFTFMGEPIEDEFIVYIIAASFNQWVRDDFLILFCCSLF